MRLRPYHLVAVLAVLLASLALLPVQPVHDDGEGERVSGEAACRYDRSMLSLLNGWRIIVVEQGDGLARVLRETLMSVGVNVTVESWGLRELAVSPPRPRHTVILVDPSSPDLLGRAASLGTVNALRELARSGAYVLFVSTGVDALRRVSRVFDPPLPVPSPAVTVTRVYGGGEVEVEVQDVQAVVVGRAYRVIDGRQVPLGVTVSVHGFDDAGEALRCALLGALERIAYLEERFAPAG